MHRLCQRGEPTFRHKTHKHRHPRSHGQIGEYGRARSIPTHRLSDEGAKGCGQDNHPPRSSNDACICAHERHDTDEALQVHISKRMVRPRCIISVPPKCGEHFDRHLKWSAMIGN